MLFNLYYVVPVILVHCYYVLRFFRNSGQIRPWQARWRGIVSGIVFTGALLVLSILREQITGDWEYFAAILWVSFMYGVVILSKILAPIKKPEEHPIPSHRYKYHRPF
jgi:Na+-translocating ferredoxin:NAD+ oxidoreductase RnfE subunit